MLVPPHSEAAPAEMGLLDASTPDATAQGRSCERVNPETLPMLELKVLLRSRGLSTKGDKGKLVQRMTDPLETDGPRQCRVCAAREEAEAAARTPDIGPTASESLIQITEAHLLSSSMQILVSGSGLRGRHKPAAEDNRFEAVGKNRGRHSKSVCAVVYIRCSTLHSEHPPNKV